MTPARFQTIEHIYREALGQQPDQVSVFLDNACKGDAALRHKVEALLSSRQQADDFIESSAVSFAAKLIQNGHGQSLVGYTIGHYKISESIGAGGMGEVYLATDTVAGRRAALKLLPMRFTGDAERLKRFQQEARAVVALNHPNILTVYEIGEENSTHYIASELIEGETLRDRLARGPMQLSEALDVAIQVASALVAAHQAGIVHRDIKPENIMLRPDGYVKVLDFGVAKLAEQEAPATMPRDEALLLVETNLGSILGTVRYMSPEQACGAPVDNRTDIWSLGVVLYEMVTGHAPFTGDTPGEVMTSILEKEPPPLTSYVKQTPAELQQIISTTLRKDRRERYQSAAEMLEGLKNLRRKMEFRAELERSRLPSWLRWIRSPVALLLLALVSALALALPFYRHRDLTTSSPPEKSIAVLPFENLSNDREDASFADGVQDDLLTKLAKIADLKVISRTSVMQYRGKLDTREIRDALRVSHVLVGSVRKTGAWLHINAQLIDTRTNTHVWAEQYDRDLKEVFALQGEIAQRVADRLYAKISAAEKIALEQPLTVDVTAFNLYNRAKNFLLDIVASATGTRKESCMQATNLLNEAVAHDPSFFQAYCQLAWIHDFAYFDGWDRTPARLALAEAAIQVAFRLHPDAGEAHLARAWHLYWGYHDYIAALSEVEKARPTLPNESLVLQLTGYIQRRQGRWEESKQNLERALDVDPRNFLLLRQLGILYEDLRRYADQEAILDRALALRPDDLEVKMDRANVEMDWKANTRPVHQLIDQIQAKESKALPEVADFWLSCALSERDPAAAAKALAALGDNPIGTERIKYGPRLWEGLLARMTKDDAKARAAFTAARADQEKLVRANPDDAGTLCILGLIDAGLGRKEEALREGRRAVALLPVEKDARGGPAMIVCFARIATWVGEKDLACEQLARAARLPSSVNYGDLKLMPWYDPLRGNPCFEQIVASLAPK
jgi:serine/threonine-protein kinase